MANKLMRVVNKLTGIIANQAYAPLSATEDAQVISGNAADGVAVTGNPVRVAGKDAGGLTQDIITDADGHVQVDVLSGGGGGAVTIADGADVTQGITTGAAIITDADGTIQRYLRGLVKLAITAGSFLVRGSVASGGIASGAVASGAVASGAVASGAVASGAIASGAVASGAVAAGAFAAGAGVDGWDLTQGVTTGAKVVTDANGTVQQYLRGLVSMMAGTVADGNDLTQGITTGAAVVTDAAGTIQQYLRGLVKLEAIKTAAVVGNSVKIEDTSATNVIAADSGASLKYYVTDVLVTNGDATVGTLVTIQDDEGSPTVLCQGYAAAAGGGFSHHFTTPVPTAANAHIHALCGTTSAEVYVTVVAFIAA